MSYVLRMNISIASKLIMPEFGLTQVQMGQIFASFMLGYALFQIPAGILGDRWGPKLVLTLAGIWWGITTMLTACVPGILTRSSIGAFAALVVTRFFLGVGEAATYPVATRAIANWVSASGRALANAVVIAGATVGSAITAPLIAWLMIHHGWKLSFYITGFAAFLLSLVWWIQSTDSPDHKKVRTEPRFNHELDGTKHDAIPRAVRTQWKMVIRNQNLWILAISYMFDSYVLFIFVFWLYTYLTDVRGFSLLRGGLFTSLPFVAASIMTPIGGYLCDRCCVQFGARRGRRIA
ncbi:MAG: MFS transporter, partial [Candidatus Acidiferrales bacterium]